ncbi:MAG: methionyl-tRNA formyltransferase [Deltaproteobacteria bacterium]|nr:methionyl-tRNA formyltransferase [Deltaproteobacteria bacterium]
MSLRIAVFGQAPFGRDVAVRLAEAGHAIVGVHVPPDAGARPDPLAEEARTRGWSLFRYKGYRRAGQAIAERVAEYRALGAELNVLPFTTVLLPSEITDHPRHRSVCFHPSILPAYRGGSALAWQIIDGARESGISIFQPDAGVDTGPLYRQDRGIPIDPGDTAASLYFDKLYPLGVDALVETVAAIAAGTARLKAQAEEGASFQGLLDDAGARLDFAREDAVSLDRRIRGCDPQPGAWARLGEEIVRLFGCRLEAEGPSAGDAAPGTVVELGPSGLCLAARGGRLRIAKVRRGEAKRPAHEAGLALGDRLT